MNGTVTVLPKFCEECGKKMATCNKSNYCYACDGNTWQKRNNFPQFLVDSQPLESVLTQLEMSAERSLI